MEKVYYPNPYQPLGISGAVDHGHINRLNRRVRDCCGFGRGFPCPHSLRCDSGQFRLIGWPPLGGWLG